MADLPIELQPHLYRNAVLDTSLEAVSATDRLLAHQAPVWWHLDSISLIEPFPFPATVLHDATVVFASDVDVYLVGDGVDATHPELPGLVSRLAGDAAPAGDFSGWGTAAAGAVTGQTAGVVRLANIIDVRVLDDTGTLDENLFVDGIAAISNDITTKGNGHGSIVLFSWFHIPSETDLAVYGTRSSNALSGALRALTDNDIPVVAPAGDGYLDENGSNLGAVSANVVWPARLEKVIAVGGVQYDESIWPYSSYGEHVDIYAPAEHVMTASTALSGGIGSLSSTRLATAQVCGVIASYMANTGQYSAFHVKHFLSHYASKSNRVTGIDNLVRDDPLMQTSDRFPVRIPLALDSTFPYYYYTDATDANLLLYAYFVRGGIVLNEADLGSVTGGQPFELDLGHEIRTGYASTNKPVEFTLLNTTLEGVYVGKNTGKVFGHAPFVEADLPVNLVIQASDGVYQLSGLYSFTVLQETAPIGARHVQLQMQYSQEGFSLDASEDPLPSSLAYELNAVAAPPSQELLTYGLGSAKVLVHRDDKLEFVKTTATDGTLAFDAVHGTYELTVLADDKNAQRTKVTL